ncbi:transglutaminase-like domain-containing protein [Limoniibacter endophyticus]|uniref:Transglutaminase n=1 Tax=Limoniibacter endophyticus TaxID=1565040 RepID=A0A8J3DH31_9HYPH|nr:transglutaminase family protein [Limoniibacter endophyticus]GHC69692.1 transglutaminase [Limoniibacter endophyticus]
MLIRVGYEISIVVEQPTALYAYLGIHPERRGDIRWYRPKETAVNEFIDNHGNACQRMVVEPGETVLAYDALVEDDGRLDAFDGDAEQVAPADIPSYCIPYLLGSRYCETDRLTPIAWQLFGHYEKGADRVKAVCDFVHERLHFSYGYARSTRTAMEAYDERIGVCRDFAHLAIAFCRALNIPARYVNGYMGDIGVEPDPAPMDYNAWFEAYLGGKWYTFDPRHNCRRIGRIIVARGRDAADVPLLNTFGPHTLNRFEVWTHEHFGALPVDLDLPVRRSRTATRYGPAGRSPYDLGIGTNVTSLL